ncbi:hypothetical protein ACLKA6_016050 [Drosophila palustris]
MYQKKMWKNCGQLVTSAIVVEVMEKRVWEADKGEGGEGWWMRLTGNVTRCQLRFVYPRVIHCGFPKRFSTSQPDTPDTRADCKRM